MVQKSSIFNVSGETVNVTISAGAISDGSVFGRCWFPSLHTQYSPTLSSLLLKSKTPSPLHLYLYRGRQRKRLRARRTHSRTDTSSPVRHPYTVFPAGSAGEGRGSRRLERLLLDGIRHTGSKSLDLSHCTTCSLPRVVRSTSNALLRFFL